MFGGNFVTGLSVEWEDEDLMDWIRFVSTVACYWRCVTVGVM